MSDPLRPAKRGDRLPAAFAALTALAGLVNVASALTPELSDRLHLLRTAAPRELAIGAHALALPAGLALLAASVFLYSRRQRAHRLAVGLLLVLGLLNLLKGLDIEEAFVSWTLAGVLIWGRAAFRVRHEADLPRVLRLGAGLVAGALVVAVMAVAAAGHWASPDPRALSTLREAIGLLLLVGGPLHFAGPAEWLPAAIGVLGVTTAAASVWLLLRPLRAAVTPCSDGDAAHRLVHAHGDDTLSFFKLREDLPRRFSPDGRAFVAYQIEYGVMVLAGDPVGPADAIPALMADVCSYADDHGLRPAAIGVSDSFATIGEAAGLRRIYLGDEALVNTADFTLEGRAVRKVRQSVTRLGKAGYTVAAKTISALDPGELEELEAVSARWRQGGPEVGFSMGMDSLENPALADTLLVIARDGEGAARGFVHFVPAAGGQILSLSLMRRDRDTPNGLSELLVVRAIEHARTLGVSEVSLNFAVGGKYMRAPETRFERTLGHLGRWLDRFFQTDSLYRFNAKFSPRWQPRYVLFDGYRRFLPTVLAGMVVEGQIARPQLRPRGTAHSDHGERRAA
jgi:lysyl-tRNA synthetase class 2